ncbi:CMP-sialic acid synthase [Glossina fuscipes fuscipes]
MNILSALNLFVFFSSLGLVQDLAKCCQLNETHAIILARGGSKGIKYKNLIELNGVSLLARTIKTIQASGLFQNIWVSTDNNRIEQEALKYGALVYRRSGEHAQDNSSSLHAVKEFLNSHTHIDRFALFQCTSVFLKAHYIREAVDKFKQNPCVFAVTSSYKLRWKRTADKKLMALNFDVTKRPRRQDWNGELIETGMFYFSNKSLVQQDRFQNEWCEVVNINSEDALEIDTFNDIELAKCLLQTN